MTYFTTVAQTPPPEAIDGFFWNEGVEGAFTNGNTGLASRTVKGGLGSAGTPCSVPLNSPPDSQND
jgi:hypothetical protein